MTDSRPASSDPTRFVLVDTSHPGNVGAAARAMKVMGFSELVLVAPRFADVLSHPEAIAFASGATDVLERARVVATLEEALAGATFACATAMTPRCCCWLAPRRLRRRSLGCAACCPPPRPPELDLILRHLSCWCHLPYVAHRLPSQTLLL